MGLQQLVRHVEKNKIRSIPHIIYNSKFQMYQRSKWKIMKLYKYKEKTWMNSL